MTIAKKPPLLAFSSRVKSAVASVTLPVCDNGWPDAMNNAISILPATIRLTDSDAQDFFRWKLGHDEIFAVGGTLLSLGSFVANVLTANFTKAAVSIAKLGYGTYQANQKYSTFLASDERFAACAEIMGVYNAKIVSNNLVECSRATAWISLSGFSGVVKHFGGSIRDER